MNICPLTLQLTIVLIICLNNHLWRKLITGTFEGVDRHHGNLINTAELIAHSMRE